METPVNTNASESLTAHGLKISESMTTPSRPRKTPRPVWTVRGNIFGLESFFRKSGGRLFRGTWSFFEDPTDSIITELQQHGRQSVADEFAEIQTRKEMKAERYACYAENAAARSDAAFDRARQISSHIPLGQPILVGHHSERQHRRDIARIENGMQKGVTEHKKSEYLACKASSLQHDATRMNSRSYIGNRIEEADKELRALKKWRREGLSDNFRYDLEARITRQEDTLSFLQNRKRVLDAEQESAGLKVPTKENLKVGFFVQYRGTWYPVVRANPKTVTIGNWLGIPHFTFKIPYNALTTYRENAE